MVCWCCEVGAGEPRVVAEELDDRVPSWASGKSARRRRGPCTEAAIPSGDDDGRRRLLAMVWDAVGRGSTGMLAFAGVTRVAALHRRVMEAGSAPETEVGSSNT
ncbi:hypothetical protein ACUV84_041264 [Puccinellia chinampoensis]